jgi:hypothetical protein
MCAASLAPNQPIAAPRIVPPTVPANPTAASSQGSTGPIDPRRTLGVAAPKTGDSSCLTCPYGDLTLLLICANHNYPILGRGLEIMKSKEALGRRGRRDWCHSAGVADELCPFEQPDVCGLSLICRPATSEPACGNLIRSNVNDDVSHTLPQHFLSGAATIAHVRVHVHVLPAAAQNFAGARP